ncbi:MAG: type II secretion system protein [bacterium]|nr:type II secretion system protein [bacterium]
MKNMHSNKRAGFSLTEILIVVGIITLMSAMILARIPAIRMQARLSTTSSNIQRIIREAQRRSTSIVEFKAGSGMYPSYGVFFDTASPAQIILYADCIIDDDGNGVVNNNDNFTFTQSSADCVGTNGLVKTELFEEGLMIKAVRIFSVNPASGTPQTKGSVEYLRPEPSIWISDQNGTLIGSGGMAIDIADETNTYKKTIVIWITGNIEIL